MLRYRVAALSLGGLLIGAPLLTGGPAYAGRIDEGMRQVTFASDRGMMGLSCHASPDVESMIVPAESTVRVVNRTGHDASLQLSGAPSGLIGSGRATEVTFHRGTTAVVLTPDCGIGADSTPVLVTASPSLAAVMPDPASPPSTGDLSADKPQTGVSSDSPSRAQRTSGTVAADDVRPARVSQGANRTTALADSGDHQTRPKIKVLSTPARTSPALAGPPDAQPTSGAPREDPSATASEPVVLSTSAEDSPSAEPVATVEPVPDQGPIGLLALTAGVCVLGVGIAAIRAIVSQRANRSGMA